MKLDRLILRDVFAYTHVDLPVGDVGPGLIAITGANGAGKTGLIEVVPGVNYQQLPARKDDHPVSFATSREALLEYWYTTDAGHFRALLNLDSQSRGVDGLLQQVSADGLKLRDLNDGKVSTLKKAIADRFPTYDLFLNGAFAAQGRGNEFARRGPSQRKDLFAEFLALGALIEKAKTAGEAAALVAAVRDRLLVVRDTLRLDTFPSIAEALDARAAVLRDADAGAATERGTLQTTIATLEARLATMQDAVAAHGAASQRIATLKETRATRHAERSQAHTDQIATGAALSQQQQALSAKRDADTTSLEKRIADNRTVIGLAEQIRAAVAATETLDATLVTARTDLGPHQAAQTQLAKDLRAAERELAALAPTETTLARSKTDADLIAHVPCEGAGPYAGCQFLVNAIAAQGRIAQLEAVLVPKAAIADRIAELTRNQATRAEAIAQLQRSIGEAERQKAAHATHAAYATSLAHAEAKIAGYREQLTTLERDTQLALEQALARHDDRARELLTRAETLDAAIARLSAEILTAEADLQGAAAGNAHAAVAQVQLTEAREALEAVIARQATVQAGREQLARDVADLQAKQVRLADVEAKLAQVEQELVEWCDLETSLGKGGLLDLELDVAGLTVTATTNALLAHALEGEFSIELVTQVEKADGSGMKDEFTIRVHDNRRGGWRELHGLSGGQKTVVQEALMCAIALYVNERSTHPIRTFWRDETGSALDPVNAIRYVEMLRKVRELGGLHQIFYISHNEAAASLADAQIHVAGGTARIVLPPYGAVQEVA